VAAVAAAVNEAVAVAAVAMAVVGLQREEAAERASAQLQPPEAG